MKENGDTRDDDDAATQAHIDRMRDTFLQIERIDAQISQLKQTKAACQRTVCEALGIKVDEVADNGHKKILVTSVPKGEFYFGDGARDGQAIACVRVLGRPQLKSGGFHKRNRDAMAVFDDSDHWFKVPYNPDGGAT